MMRFICLLLVIVLSNLTAISQPALSFTGKIINSQSQPVSGATIVVLNTSLALVSDSNGSFSIKAIRSGNYTLYITSVGYAGLSTDIIVSDHTANSIRITLTNAASNLDAVIVTAQKKEEALQKIPISITSLSSRQVKEFRLWHSNEITAIVPNLYSAHSGDDRNVTSIRGIATTSYDPAVATYIDGVNQFGLDTYIANLIDVERIEVLRGPQGSLYGRNAMAGVINIITKQPTNTSSGFAEINFGNYKQQRYSAGLRSPVIKDKLFVGAAAVYQARDGYYTNEFNNTSYDKQHSFTGNYYIKYIAGNNWKINLNAKHHNNRNNGAFPLVFGVEEALNNPFKLMQNATATMIDNIFNSSLSIDHDGRLFNFTSLTSYQSNHRYYDAPLDGDFSPIDGVTVINDYGNDWNKVKVITQEFKFTSPASTTSSLKWTAGAYFFHQDNPVKQTTHFGEDAEMMGVPDKNFSVTNTNKGKSTGAALYGQINYAITPKLELIGGLRFDYEKKKYSVLGEYQKDPDPVFVTTPDTSATENYNALSPRLGLSFQLSEKNLFYLTYSRGYRTGGFTQLSTDPSQPPLYPYKPEYSNSFEAGLKNMFWQNKLRMNITLFYTKVTDAQVPTLVLPDAITVTRNAGELSSKGMELELSSTPVKNLQVDYNFGYTDAEYTTLKIPQNGTEVNLAGKKQLFTPATTSMLAAQYNWQIIESKLVLVFRGEWMNLGKQYFDLANNISQSSYSLINTRIGITIKTFELFFWGRNLGDEKYIAYAYDFGAVHLGDPKTYGITFTAKW